MTATLDAQKTALIQDWGARLYRSAASGKLDAGKPIGVQVPRGIAGPRAAVLEFNAGLDADRFLRKLQSSDGAIVRQFIPFEFVGDPLVFMRGRYVRVEAGWPDALAERNIRIGDLLTEQRAQHLYRSGRWVIGKNELGQTTTIGLGDNAPHMLISGTSGSGKTTAVHSLIVQLSRSGDLLVLIDGKNGRSLRDFDRLPGTIGPLAVTVEQARAALAWSFAEMMRRLASRETELPRLVIVIDEIQTYIDDAASVDLIRKIAQQGREVLVHLIVTTQRPTVATLGDSAIKLNLSGRLALHVPDASSSQVATGQADIRADHLLGAGDAYAIVPGGVQRVQVAYLTRDEITAALTGTPRLTDWPDYSAESVPDLPVSDFGDDELAVSTAIAFNGAGRPALLKALELASLPRPGADRARRLLDRGRKLLEALRGQGYDLCELTD